MNHPQENDANERIGIDQLNTLKPKLCCEQCESPVEDGRLTGCELCGAMYGDCCNSETDGICVMCVE